MASWSLVFCWEVRWAKLTWRSHPLWTLVPTFWSSGFWNLAEHHSSTDLLTFSFLVSILRDSLKGPQCRLALNNWGIRVGWCSTTGSKKQACLDTTVQNSHLILLWYDPWICLGNCQEWSLIFSLMVKKKHGRTCLMINSHIHHLIIHLLNIFWVLIWWLILNIAFRKKIQTLAPSMDKEIVT